MIGQVVRRLINDLKSGKITHRTAEDALLLRFGLRVAPLDDDVLVPLVQTLYRWARRRVKTRPDVALPILWDTRKFLSRVRAHHAAQTVIRKTILRLRKQLEDWTIQVARGLAQLFSQAKRKAETAETYFRVEWEGLDKFWDKAADILYWDVEDWYEVTPKEVAHTIIDYILDGLESKGTPQEIVETIKQNRESLENLIKDKIYAIFHEKEKQRPDLADKADKVLDEFIEKLWQKLRAPVPIRNLVTEHAKQLVDDLVPASLREGNAIVTELEIYVRNEWIPNYLARIIQSVSSVGNWGWGGTEQSEGNLAGAQPNQINLNELSQSVTKFVTHFESLFAFIAFAELLSSAFEGIRWRMGRFEDDMRDEYGFGRLIEETYKWFAAFLAEVISYAYLKLEREIYDIHIGEILLYNSMSKTAEWVQAISYDLTAFRERAQDLENVEVHVYEYEEETEADRRTIIEGTKEELGITDDARKKAITEQLIYTREYFYKLFGNKTRLELEIKIKPTLPSEELIEARHRYDIWVALTNATETFAKQIRNIFSQDEFSLDFDRVKDQPPPLGHFKTAAKETRKLINLIIPEVGKVIADLGISANLDNLKSWLIQGIEEGFRLTLHEEGVMKSIDKDTILDAFIYYTESFETEKKKENPEYAGLTLSTLLGIVFPSALSEKIKETVINNITSIILWWLQKEIEQENEKGQRQIEVPQEFFTNLEKEISSRIKGSVTQIVNEAINRRKSMVNQVLNNTLIERISKIFGIEGKKEQRFKVVLSMELDSILALGTYEDIDDGSCWWSALNMSIPQVAGATNVLAGTLFDEEGEIFGRFLLYIKNGDFAVRNMRLRIGETRGRVNSFSRAIVEALWDYVRRREEEVKEKEGIEVSFAPTPADNTHWTLGLPSPAAFDVMHEQI